LNARGHRYRAAKSLLLSQRLDRIALSHIIADDATVSAFAQWIDRNGGERDLEAFGKSTASHEMFGECVEGMQSQLVQALRLGQGPSDATVRRREAQLAGRLAAELRRGVVRVRDPRPTKVVPP
jgi:hypothetical protein